MGSNASIKFCGRSLAHNAEIKGMSGTSNVTMKIYPRTIGAVISPTGINKRTVSVECRAIVGGGVSRTNLELKMNSFNEFFLPKIGTLEIDENEYYNCAINSISYNPKVVKNYLIFTVEFELGVQKESDVTVPRQIIPATLFADTRGRTAKFTSTDTGRVFNFWHNMDIVRNAENIVIAKIYDPEGKEQSLRQQGGIEKIIATCWMKSSSENQHEGWRQTVGSYMFNIMHGPLGELGTLEIGNTTMVSNCILNEVKLEGIWPTSARYGLVFTASLQC